MSKILFVVVLLVGLAAQAASVPVRSFNTISELTTTPASGQGITVLLNGYTAANVYGEPAAYVHHPELSTTLHNPPMYIKEANSNGVWVADFINADQIDARLFGGFPDGIVDNTAAVQAAVNFAGSTKAVYLSPGEWRLNQLLVTNKNARLVGGSAGNTSQTGQTRIVPYSTNYAVIFGNDLTRMEGAKIEGITFDGEGTQPYGLWINGGAYEVDVSSVAVRAFTGIGMLVGGNTNTPISLINFWNSRFDAYEGLSTAAVKVQQTTNWPTAFVTSVGFHGCHFDEAGADDGSQTLWIDSVDVFADGGTYFDLGEGGEGILFSKSVAAVAPKLKGDFVAETNGGGVLARADFSQSSYRIGNLFPSGSFHLQGPVQWSDGTNITHYGRGWGYYQSFQDYPYILGAANYQDPDDGSGWDWNQKNQVAVTGGALRMYSTTNQVYLLANGNSVVTRTLSTNAAHYSLRVDATPTPTNHAASFGGSSYFTGQGKLGVNQTYPQADIVAAGGISAGVNIDPGTGYIQGSKGFVVYPRTMVDNELAPFRSINHTLTSASGAITNDFLHQFGFVTGNAVDYPGASAYAGYFIPRHTGTGLWNFIGGPYIESISENSGNLISAQGLTIRPITVSSSGNVGSAFGLRVVSPTYSSTGVATNVYGIYVDNQTAAGNAYALYTGSGLVRFGGNITAIGDIDVGGGITLGGVYRTTWPSGGGGATNGTDVWVEGVQQTTFNLQDGSEIAGAFSASNYTYSIVANSIATNKVDSTFRSFFLDRANHTGTQTASTISDFADTQWAAFTNSMVASNNISFAYDTSNKKLMISSTGGGGSATNAPVIAVDGVVATNVNFADSSELLVTKTSTNVTYALNTNGVAAGTYGGVTLTVNSKGLITSITSGTNTGWVTNQVDRPIFITMDAVTIASAVTNETSILGKFGANQTNIITANVLASNKVIRIKASGTFTPPGSDWSGAYVRVKFGGRILTGQIAEMNSTQPSPGAWFLEASMHVRGSGSNATNVIVGYFANQESEPIANSGANIIALVPSGTLDTTINNTLDITFQNEATQPLAFTCNHAEAYYLGDDMITGGGVLTALDASWIVQGTFDVARMPSSVLLDSEAALLYGGLNNNNSWTGTQTFTNDVDFLGDVSFNMLTVGTFQSTTWTNLGDVTVGSNLVVSGSISLGGVTRTNWPTGGGSSITINSSGTLTNIADGADITLATSGGTTATPTLTDTGVTNGTYTLSANGNTATVDAKGRITAIEDFDDVNDFDLVDEFVGPSTYTLFNPAANSGSTAAGGVATTLTNLLGTRWIMTSGSNQYPILVCSAPFKNAGMQYVQFAMRFYFPLLSTDADPWEFQMGIYDSATTTNRPVSGSWITANTNLGNANFFLCNGTNSTYNYVDTGIPMTATNWHDWAVRMTPSNSIALYGLTPVATNSLNYPTSTYFSLFAIRMSRFMHTASAQRYIYVDNGRIKFRSGPGR